MPQDLCQTVETLPGVPSPPLAPAELTRSEAFYHSLFDLSPDGVLVATLNGTIVLANPRTAEILEFDRPQELIGRNAIELYVHPEDRALLLEQVAQHPRLENRRGEFRTRRGKTIITNPPSRLIAYESPSCPLSVFPDVTQPARTPHGQ